MRVLWKALGASAVLIAGSLVAAPSMDELVIEGLQNNARVQAAHDHWQATLEQSGYAAVLPSPRVSYGQFLKSVETRVGPQRYRLGIAQKIPWIGGLIAERRVAKMAAQLAESELDAIQTSLRQELSEALFEYRYVQEATRIRRDYLELISVLEQTARSRVETGASGADVIQAQMTLSRIDDGLRQSQEQELTVAARINALLNRDLGAAIELPEDLDRPIELSQDLEAGNPDLRRLQAQDALLTAKRRKIGQQRYPDITIGADWIKTSPATMPTRDNGKDPVLLYASVELPIWVDSYRAKEREADLQLMRVRQLYRQKLFDLRAKQTALQNQRSALERHIKLLEDILLPKAEQALSILGDGYRTGSVDFERFLGAQTTLLDLILQAERARADLGITHAQYQALQGEG